VLECANHVSAQLQKLTGNDPSKFLYCTVEEFLRHYDNEVFYEKIVEIGKLQKSMYQYEDEVLTLAGMGAEYDKVKVITHLVCKVIQWLEEVLCMAMVDATEVEEMYKARQLSFQKLEHLM
jgi:hypothetical protein